ncbi:MAG: trigger factor [Candidatus Omnitrophota bacterium]
MKVAVKKIDALRRELSFQIPKERVAVKQDEVYKDVARRAKIKGFRPGKAPRDVVEAEYGALIKEETLKKIIPEAYQEGIEGQDLLPLDYPEIKDVDFKDGNVTFKAAIEIRPEIKLGNYRGIKVTRKSNEVTDEDINKTLDYFRKSQGKEDGAELDDDFVKGLGYPNLDDFKQALTRQMELDKDRQNKMDVERQITEHLVKIAKMAVPQSLVSRQLEHRLADLKKRLKSQGLPEEEMLKKEQEMRKELKDPVEKDVKLYLIFSKIAEEEKIEVKEGENLPHKVMEFLMKEADWQDEKAGKA